MKGPSLLAALSGKKGSRSALLALLAAGAPLLAGVARAGEAAGPPAGWEEPPPLVLPAPRGSGSARAAACCRYDKECCLKQSEADAATPETIRKGVSIKASELPQALRKTAEKGAPPLEGVPAPHYLDDTGVPPPWPSGPKGHIRIMPPARFGEIRWQDGIDPFFQDVPNRGMGYGVLEPVKGKDAVQVLLGLAGKLSYTALNQGENGKIMVDLVEGALAGSLDLKATEWSHVEAIPVAEGYAHAFRGFFEGEERVVIVLPEVIRAGESQGVKMRGGFFPSRFSRSEAFTFYALPIGPATGAMAAFTLTDTEFRRWFPHPAALGNPTTNADMIVSSSQTTAEPEAHVSVLIFPGRRF